MTATLRSLAAALILALILAMLLITGLQAARAASHLTSAAPALADGCYSGETHC